MLYREKKYRNYFLFTFGGLFVLLFTILYVAGLLPEEIGGRGATTPITATSSSNPNPVMVEDNIEDRVTTVTRPSKLEIPSVGISTIILHPNSPTVEVLDNALLKGAVYYPGSGTIENGNIFVFGHSTGLRVVQNPAFKTFNNLKSVMQGEEVYVTGEDGKRYVYKVISVELVNEDEALVTFDTSSRMITISTCNTFGAKQERHVVKAVFDREV